MHGPAGKIPRECARARGLRALATFIAATACAAAGCAGAGSAAPVPPEYFRLGGLDTQPLPITAPSGHILVAGYARFDPAISQWSHSYQRPDNGEVMTQTWVQQYRRAGNLRIAYWDGVGVPPDTYVVVRDTMRRLAIPDGYWWVRDSTR